MRIVPAVWLAAACGLVGCMPTEADILAAGWVRPRVLPAPAPIFCYRTLANADCYTEPEPGWESRYIESYPLALRR